VRLFFLTGFVLLATTVGALTNPIPPSQGVVTDTTDLVDAPSKAAIEKIANELSSTRLIKFRMLVLFTIDQMDADTYGSAVFDYWEMGDNGLLLVFSLFDRKYAIITGERVADMVPEESREKIEWGVISYMARGKFSQGALFGASVVGEMVRQYRYSGNKLIKLDRKKVLRLFLPMLAVGLLLNFVMGGGLFGALATMAGGAFGYVTLGVFGMIVGGAIGLFLNLGRRYSEK